LKILLIAFATLAVWKIICLFGAKEATLESVPIIQPIPHESFPVKEVVQKQFLVHVYYEVLCPDSKHFVKNKLVEAQKALDDYIDVKLVPYGKATTTLDDGKLQFSCQHGPVECEGNKVHACTAHVLEKDQSILVPLVGCMIDNNQEPLGALDRCSSNLNEDIVSKIEDCLSSGVGDNLLKEAGALTHSLNPAVSFIPTITINNSQKDQNQILSRGLVDVICQRMDPRDVPDVCIK